MTCLSGGRNIEQTITHPWSESPIHLQWHLSSTKASACPHCLQQTPLVHSDTISLTRAPEHSHQLLKKCSIGSPYAPPLPGMFPKELKTGAKTHILTQMLRAAPVTMAERWKQPKSPPALEWINEMWSVYTIEYYLAMKRQSYNRKEP